MRGCSKKILDLNFHEICLLNEFNLGLYSGIRGRGLEGGVFEKTGCKTI